MRNKAVKSSLKTSVRKFREASATGDVAAAETHLRAASRELDKAATKGVIHKNQAAQRKSKLAASFQQALRRRLSDRTSSDKLQKAQGCTPLGLRRSSRPSPFPHGVTSRTPRTRDLSHPPGTIENRGPNPPGPAYDRRARIPPASFRT